MDIEIETRRGQYTVGRIITPMKVQPLVAVGDLHCGSRGYNESEVLKIIKWIKEKDAVWFGIGDMMECATKTSIGSGVYEQSSSPQEQIEYITETFEPIKKRCFGMVKGNHEERAYKTTGIDPMAIICHNLGIPYYEWEIFAIISNADKKQGGCCYTLYGVHSYTGNKNAGLALAWNEREIQKYIDADIIMRAHSHDLGFDPKTVLVFNKNAGTIEERMKYSVMTGHYLQRPNSYIAARAGAPKPPGTVALNLEMDKDNRKVTPEYLI